MRKTNEKLQKHPIEKLGGIAYNIQDLKLYPGKLQKHMELKESIYEYKKTQTPQRNWEENGKTNTNDTPNSIPTCAKNKTPKRH